MGRALRARLRFQRWGTRAAILLVAGLAVGLPSGVWAGHQFSDVPDTHPFHDEISTVAGAGITTGFADGTFRPSSTITRQAAAAFFERGLGRVSRATTFGDVSLGSGGLPRRQSLVSVAVEAGAAGSGNGFVSLHGSFMAYVSGNNSACPCDLEFILRENGAHTGVSRYLTLPASAGGELGFVINTGAIETVRPLAADASAAYQLQVVLHDANVSPVWVRGSLTAQYVPFSGDGDATLPFEHTCTTLESESNDTLGTGNPMPASGCVRARLFSATDVDVFRIGVASGQILRAETKSVEGAGCSGDTLLEVFDVSGTQLAADHSSGAGACSRIVLGGLSTNTYYLQVTSPETDVFEYRLEAAAASAVSGEADSADGGAPEEPSYEDQLGGSEAPSAADG